MKLPVVILLSAVLAQAVYVPGTPGAEWSQEELLAVRAKLYQLFRNGLAPPTVRLAFHDCLKYEDGSGGCDGCLNWSGVERRFTRAELKSRALPNLDKTNNNGLELVVSELEKVYTDGNYPHLSPIMASSLRDSGKSRADLWAYAGMVAVEYGMEMNNIACDNQNDPRVAAKTCMHAGGEPECYINPERYFQFQSGRSDCVSDTYKATKEEEHPSATSNGVATIQFFKDNFGFSGRETAAIFGAHTFGQFHTDVSMISYMWTARNTEVFNNDYYKVLVGEDRWLIDKNDCLKIGDAYGHKPKSRWVANARLSTLNGGPHIWVHQNLACPHPGDFEKCYTNLQPGQVCRPDPSKWGQGPRNDGEPDVDVNAGCEQFRHVRVNNENYLSCEFGLYRSFETANGVPYGCRGLEIFNETIGDINGKLWSKIDGELVAPDCPKQTLSEPNGSPPLFEVMEEFARDQSAWINTFIPTMEKMSRNGYSSLNAPQPRPANLECGIPEINGNVKSCYVPSPPGSEPAFMIGSKLGALEGKVWQYNEKTDDFEFAPKAGTKNQKWKWSESGTQLINMASEKPLVVDSNVEWTIREDRGDMLLINTLAGRFIDCRRAMNGGKCRTVPLSDKIRSGHRLYKIDG